MNTEVNKRTQCGCNNWMKMSGVLCDKRVPTHVKGKIHKMIVQPAMLYGIETVPMTSTQVKKLEVTEMQMCRWACGHTLRNHVTKDHREVQKSKIGVVWTRQEASPRIRRKKDSADGTTWVKKARKTEAEMGGLCQPGHDSHRNDERRGP